MSEDLKDAFHHTELAEESRDLTCFGLKSTGEVFQKIMVQMVFRGLSGVAIYIDNMIIYARTLAEQDRILRLVLKRSVAIMM